MRRTFPQLCCCLLLIAPLWGAGERDAVAKPRVQTARIEINAQGYQPASVKLRRNVRARLTFVRTTEATCVRDIVLPDLGLRRELPLNQPVVVSFVPKRRGSFTFVCGMNMMRGELIVR
jgi:plastocyanin domain-containing protein